MLQKCCQYQWVLFRNVANANGCFSKNVASANGCFSEMLPMPMDAFQKMLLMFNIHTRSGSRGHTSPLQLIYFQHGNLYDKAGKASTHLLSPVCKQIYEGTCRCPGALCVSVRQGRKKQAHIYRTQHVNRYMSGPAVLLGLFV